MLFSGCFMQLEILMTITMASVCDNHHDGHEHSDQIHIDRGDRRDSVSHSIVWSGITTNRNL